VRSLPAIPAFSIFSASTELLVTAAVFYVLRRAWARGEFRGALLAVTLAFEGMVNVAYMAYRVAVPARAAAPSWTLPFAAAHGLLSIVMYLVLVVLAFGARFGYRRGENYFRERPRATWAFVALWSLSVLSGEVLFAGTYLA
jgi:hypothetical protein